MDSSDQKKSAPLNTAALLAKKHNEQKQHQHKPHFEKQEKSYPTVTVQDQKPNNLPDMNAMLNTASAAVSNISMDTPKSWFHKGLGYAKGFAARVLVNFGAIVSAGVITMSLPTDDAFIPFFSAYLGLICLVARGTSLKGDWLVPTILGLLQTIIAIALGFSMPEALFWGGASTWLQRLFIKRFNMGTEWVTGACLAPLAFVLAPALITQVPFILSFCTFTAAGVVYGQLHTRLEARRRDIEAQKQKDEKKKEEKEKEEKRRQEIANDPLYIHTESIAELRTKLLLLPKEMQPTLVNLTNSADAIITCMREDQRDHTAGEKFFKRYLPATHSVLENYCKLAGSAMSNDASAKNIHTALKESEEVLKRLELAFKEEHSTLLRNDVDDFSADLRVLDTLLKMDGR